MKYQRRYFLFRQTFKTPLKTAKGVWGNRASLVLREDHGNGRVSFGEFAPILGSPDEDLSIAIQEAKAWARGEDNADQLNYLVPAIQSLKSSIWTKMGEVCKISESAKLWGINNSAKYGVIKRKLGLLSPKMKFQLLFLGLVNYRPRLKYDSILMKVFPVMIYFAGLMPSPNTHLFNTSNSQLGGKTMSG